MSKVIDDELIEVFKKNDKEIKKIKETAKERDSRIAALEKELEKKQALLKSIHSEEQRLEEIKNSNILQKLASEAVIYRKHIDKNNIELFEIDKEISELMDKAKVRINRLAAQFLELNKEKDKLLLLAQEESVKDIERDNAFLENANYKSSAYNEELILREVEQVKSLEDSVRALNYELDLDDRETVEFDDNSVGDDESDNFDFIDEIELISDDE